MAQTNRPDAGRPDPDALLAAFRRETAGRLKVFLGAAPGVGKTYAMLQNARRLKNEGVDVVIGLVETHGRAETSALVEGLEVLPRRRIEYHGRTLEEFDIDAALERKPKLQIAGIRSAGRTSRSCSMRGSASGRRSTSSISRVLPTSFLASRASLCARPFPIGSCRARPTSFWSILRPTSSSSA
jgi:hypothetical protein